MSAVPGQPVIDIRGMVKRFGSVTALAGLDLTVQPGEVHGFLGPNGAGKSTTLRAILGLLRTSGGTASVFGLDPWRDTVAIHRRLAYVPGDVALWPNLSGGETIDMLLRMRGIEPRRTQRQALLEQFELDPSRRGRAYSKGNRQKVALVAALAADVDLLVLDEPTAGLDPLMERVFAGCIAERVARGTTVLLSSHILSEVEAMADRVTIIREGRTVETGSLAELRHLRRSRLSAEVLGPVPTLAGIDGVHDLLVEGNRLSCSVAAEAMTSVLTELARAGVRSLTSAPPTLEELFLDAYRTPRGGATATSGAATAKATRRRPWRS